MRRFFQYLAVAATLFAVLAVLAFLLYTGFGRYMPPRLSLGRRALSPSAPGPAAESGAGQAYEPGVVVEAVNEPVPADALPEVIVPVDVDALAEEPTAGVTVAFGGMPNKPDPTVELIDRRARKGEWSGALALCRQILDADPRRNDVRLRLAGILVAQGRVNDGYREAALVLADSPEDARANLFMGEVVFRQGLPSLAVNYARKAVSIDAGLLEGRKLLARALTAEGSFTPAREGLEALINVVPNDLDVVLGLAAVCDEQGDTERADQLMDKALEMQPASPVVHLVRGHRYLKGGHVDEAMASYRKVLEITPANVVALNNLASLLAEQTGQTEEATRLASVAWQLAPGSPEVADTLGWLQYGAGDYRQATALLAMAVRKRPQDPQVRYHFAAALVAIDRLVDAETHLDAALKMQADFEDAAAARALLEKIRKNELKSE